ncbi:DUF6401 family natural product biosynthesis protein [Kribbella shirazensis]|uniref:Uncharacterized protein n=1 Tax=Kribbella shirazensis TaxID=1105143 RepID=A0A7X5VD67_9ACTN|nr:DUF6401 family natural product biosynthesis protein [Kribbella shirazensis]NIK59070.1 hypothetical protein [Kribbella shirazensis]
MAWLRIMRESAARRELAVLKDQLLAGLGAYSPALQAAIDQHAAAVRDILGLTAGSAGPVELAAYARGVQDSAAERGWRIDGAGDDWVMVRLLATVSLSSSERRSGLHDLPRL